MSSAGQTSPSSGQQKFPRAWNLSVSSSTSGDVLTLSADTIADALRIRFRTVQNDVDSPNKLIARIFNVSSETKGKVTGASEFDLVDLTAGYQGNVGNIFSGSVVQYRVGREDQIDTYLEIIANDGDQALNLATINVTLAPGAGPNDEWNQIKAALQKQNVEVGYTPSFQGPIFPRGKTLYGLALASARDFAANQNARVSVQNGKLVVIPLTGYIPGPPIDVNPETGMLFMPEQTADGIRVTSLIDPNLQVGQAIKLNTADIQRAQFSADYGWIVDAATLPWINITDGLYRVVVSEFEGDTRGNEWYAHLTCFAIGTDTGKVASYP
jgi:hypothetical protein